MAVTRGTTGNNQTTDGAGEEVFYTTLLARADAPQIESMVRFLNRTP